MDEYCITSLGGLCTKEGGHGVAWREWILNVSRVARIDQLLSEVVAALLDSRTRPQSVEDIDGHEDGLGKFKSIVESAVMIPEYQTYGELVNEPVDPMWSTS